MAGLFTTIFYQPILNVLVILYNTVSFQDVGVAIILLTALIRFALWPLNQKAIRSQKSLQDLQPKLDELKKKYADDKAGLSQAIMALYKENKINPFSSCLPLLIQFPFLIAVYQVFRDGLSNKLDLVYPFISRPETINLISFGFLNLGKPNIVLAILAGAAQFWQAKSMLAKRPAIKVEGSKDEDMAAIMSKQMTYFMPAITVFMGVSLPGGLTLYWLVITLLTSLQQWLVFRAQKNKEKKTVEGELVK